MTTPFTKKEAQGGPLPLKKRPHKQPSFLKAKRFSYLVLQYQVHMEVKGKESKLTVPLHPNLEKRRSSEGDLPAIEKEEEYKEHQQLTKHGRRRFRKRIHTVSCSSYFNNNQVATSQFLSDPRVVMENAKHLSHEEMNSIHMDILKPLDFFELFFNRLKVQDNEQTMAN